jgi:2-haloacid dehalogenase
LVDEVISCDAVGRGKPDGKVYDVAWERCGEVVRGESGKGDDNGVKNEERVERWFVACHTWDVAAARKKG